MGDEALGHAITGHLHYAWNGPVFTLMLLAPYIAVGMISDSLSRRGRGRTAAVLFCICVLALLYFYFIQYHAYQQALIDEMWTAAALSMGLLPFFIGAPVVLAASLAWLGITTHDSRIPRAES